MNVLVTGAAGQLGSELRAVAVSSRDRYIFTDVAELDITSEEAVLETVRRERIGAIINCAAFTDVEGAEDRPELAERLNAGAVGILARALAGTGGLLVHISTDYVFGLEPYNTPCKEDMKGTPTGVYGLTKLHGEQAVLESGCHYLIFRTAWLYSEFGRNFVKTMLRLTAEKPVVSVVFDQAGTPTYALDLAKAIFKIVEERLYEGRDGIYNYSGEGVCSWYDFTKEIASLAGHGGCDIRPCHSDEYPSKVRRPAYSVLDKTKFKETFGISVPYWKDSLKQCIDNLKNI
ncbi:MAG: dTDP-4-dehydrorhamnose reductase [Bacteroidales bacterium]|nr:dTDP-4-dehydrorhamnose reductase [Bacteroidales bacterium]MBR0029084.1 dTDP-4-dehydrorhamnose reductase [Bacteroidales bacterium]